MDLGGVAERLGRRGEVPRDDVAAVLVACLDEPGTSGPIAEAIRALV